MIEEQLRQYIEESKARGYSDRKIRSRLITSGWHPNEVYSVLPVEKPNDLKIFSSILIILAIIMILPFIQPAITGFAGDTHIMAEVNCNPPAGVGDWNITVDTECENRNLNLTGNLTIYSGNSLTFRNVTLKFNNSVNGQHGIVVGTNAAFYIYDMDNDPATTSDRSNISSLYGTYVASPKNATFFVVNSTATLRINNSEIHNVGWSITSESSKGLAIKSNNNIIENSLISGGWYGIYLLSSHNNTIQNTKFTQNFAAVCMEISRNNTFIYNNATSSFSYALLLNVAINNTVRNNNVDFNDGSGIKLISGSNDNVVINNTFNSNGANGVWIDSADNITIENNTANYNSGKGFNSLSGDYHIIRKNIANHNGASGFVLGDYNIIENNEAINNSDGFTVGDYNNVSNNIASNSTGDDGFSINSNNNLTNNSASFSAWVGVAIYDSNNRLVNNSFYNNTENGIYMNTDGNNNIIINNKVYDNLISNIYSLDVSNNTIYSSTLSSSLAADYDVQVGGDGNLTLVNVSFDKSKTDYAAGSTTDLYVKWYTWANVTSSGSAMGGASVTVDNVNGTQLWTNLTEDTGLTDRFETLEYHENLTGLYNYTPFTVTASRAGYDSNSITHITVSNTQYNITINTSTPASISQNPGRSSGYGYGEDGAIGEAEVIDGPENITLEVIKEDTEKEVRFGVGYVSGFSFLISIILLIIYIIYRKKKQQ